MKTLPDQTLKSGVDPTYSKSPDKTAGWGCSAVEKLYTPRHFHAMEDIPRRSKQVSAYVIVSWHGRNSTGKRGIFPDRLH